MIEFSTAQATSPASPLYLPCISTVSPLHLHCISPASPMRMLELPTAQVSADKKETLGLLLLLLCFALSAAGYLGLTPNPTPTPTPLFFDIYNFKINRKS